MTIISYAINGPAVDVIELYQEDADDDDPDNDEESVPFPILSRIIWITFGAVVSFLFITFLVSLYTLSSSVHRMNYCIQYGIT